MQLATGGVVNAFWDLLTKQVWRLLADLSPEDIADIVDYRYLTDVLDRDEALAMLRRAEAGKAERIAILEREGYACYTTSAGWLGYDDAEQAAPVPGGGRCRLQPYEDEGRARPRGRHPPAHRTSTS